MKKLITLVVLFISMGFVTHSQTFYFLAYKVDYPTPSMSDGVLIANLYGNYQNAVEFHIDNSIVSYVTDDTLAGLDEPFFGTINGVVIYVVDITNGDTIATAQMYDVLADVEVSCNLLSGPLLDSCDGDLNVYTSFAFFSGSVSWKENYAAPTFTSIGDWYTLDRSDLCPGYYNIFFTTEMSSTEFYVEDMTGFASAFDLDVFSTPSSPSFCSGEAFSYVSGGTAPYTYIWDGMAGAGTASSLCQGLHTLKVIDNAGDSAITTFAVADSNFWYIDPFAFGPYDDTLYFLAENCSLDYTTPVDMIYVVSFSQVNDSTVAASFAIVQGAITTIVNDTAQFDQPLSGNVFIDMTQFCLTKSLGGSVIRFNGISAADASITTNAKKDFFIYPNPASQNFTVVGQNVQTIVIYNAAGQIVHRSAEMMIDVSAFPVGLYYVLISDADGEMIGAEKLVVN